jgi:hypothetical protein
MGDDKSKRVRLWESLPTNHLVRAKEVSTKVDTSTSVAAPDPGLSKNSMATGHLKPPPSQSGGGAQQGGGNSGQSGGAGSGTSAGSNKS